MQLFEGAFGYAVVTQIKDGNVHLFRPYATTSDFSTTAGVIPYVGFEPVVISIDSGTSYTVDYRRDIK